MKFLLIALLFILPLTGTSKVSYERELLYSNLVPANQRDAFCQQVILTADRLHIDPNWLMICMRFESAGTFRANVRNHYSGAVGLIQFIPNTAYHLGTTPKKLAAMTLVQQLAYVEKYFQPYAGKMTDVYDVYLVIFAPAFLGLPRKTILYRMDSPTQLGRNRYNWNKVFDANQDGFITIREVVRQIKQFVP